MSKSMERPKVKKSELLWEELFSKLSPEAQAAAGQQTTLAPAESEEELAFQRFQIAASPLVRQVVNDQRNPAAAFPADIKPQYWVVQQEEGENPTCKCFRNNVKLLAEHLYQLGDKDIFVHVFYGVPMQFTQGPNRVLMLPDNTAIQFQPVVRLLDELLDAVNPQEDGFLGPPELRALVPIMKKPEEEIPRDADADGEFPG